MAYSTVDISEIFYSIQGEGVRTGIPSIFVRTALCNLKCEGFGCEYEIDGKKKRGCDSYFSVDPSFSKSWSKYCNYQDLVDDIDSNIPDGSKFNLLKPDIVITGGEPTIYWNSDILQRVIMHYITRDHKITIETNGSIPIEFTKRYQNDILFSISVKLSSSGEAENRRINIDNISNILEHSPQSYLKFVVSRDNWEEDYKEIKKILYDIPVYVNNIYLMPMGHNKEELEYNSEFIFKKAMDSRFFYSDRTHIRIFNDKQGV